MRVRNNVIMTSRSSGTLATMIPIMNTKLVVQSVHRVVPKVAKAINKVKTAKHRSDNVHMDCKTPT
jgi:hypothetical protein